LFRAKLLVTKRYISIQFCHPWNLESQISVDG
jgi:hypothetical protein